MSNQELHVGDLVIVNEFDRPSGRLVAVVVDIVVPEEGKLLAFKYEYLSNDSDLDSYSNPPKQSLIEEATRIAEFGVRVHAHDGQYWCETVEKSRATYPDGRTRKWQEPLEPERHTTRPHLAGIVWPF